jgi:hypothetical protein
LRRSLQGWVGARAYGEQETAFGGALIVGLAYALAATAVALFVLGLAKGKVARLALVRSGLQVLVIGGASAGVGYLIGNKRRGVSRPWSRAT